MKGEELNIVKKNFFKKIQKQKINEIEYYVIKSEIVKKLASMIFQSEIFNYFLKKIDEFRNYKLIEQIKKKSYTKTCCHNNGWQ